MASFTLKLRSVQFGDLDLSDYVQVAQGKGLDPAGPGYLEPGFSDSPFGTGQDLVSVDEKNREPVWPLFLKAASKDALTALVASINQQLQLPDVQIEWKDKDSTLTSYLDVEYGRLDLGYDFRRGEHNYIDATLKIWASPYAHTATTRIVSTVSASGMVVAVATLPALNGDQSALADVTITAASSYEGEGRLVAWAPIKSPSYIVRHPAASLISLLDTATYRSATNAIGSRYFSVDSWPTSPANAQIARLAIPGATLYEGRNRVFALAQSHTAENAALRAFDWSGEPLGPTVVASSRSGYGLVDLGILDVNPPAYPTQAEITLLAGQMDLPENQSLADWSPALRINDIMLLPAANTVAARDGTYETIAQDGFDSGTGALIGTVDQIGNTWATAITNSIAPLTPIRLGNSGWAVGTVGATIMGAVVSATSGDIRVRGEVQAFGASTFHSMMKRNASQWVAAVAGANGSYGQSYLSLVTFTADGGTTVLASQAFAYGNLIDRKRLTLHTVGPRAYANLEPRVNESELAFTAGSYLPIASIGASSADVAMYGQAGFSARAASQIGYLQIYDFSAARPATHGMQPRDDYHFDGVQSDSWRVSAASGLQAALSGKQFGAIPAIPVPSCYGVAVLCAPMVDGQPVGQVDVVVKVRERFRFVR